MKNITENAEFDALVASNDSGLTLVDFHTTWCGPCKMLAPLVAEVAGQHPEHLNVVKVDADECQQTTAKYGVRGVPTLMLFKDGEPVATKVGAASLRQLEAFVAGHLSA